ncbi:MAG: hypothetical protein LW870_12420 [Pirellula sp.]|nr:hypothetical protein [Pirellula sp.]
MKNPHPACPPAAPLSLLQGQKGEGQEWMMAKKARGQDQLIAKKLRRRNVC